MVFEEIFGYLADLGYLIIFFLFYPVYVFVSGLWEVIVTLLGSVLGLIANFLILLYAVYSLTFGFLHGLIPEVSYVILTIGFWVRVVLVLYSHVKGKSIAGFNL